MNVLVKEGSRVKTENWLDKFSELYSSAYENLLEYVQSKKVYF